MPGARNPERAIDTGIPDGTAFRPRCHRVSVSVSAEERGNVSRLGLVVKALSVGEQKDAGSTSRFGFGSAFSSNIV